MFFYSDANMYRKDAIYLPNTQIYVLTISLIMKVF